VLSSATGPGGSTGFEARGKRPSGTPAVPEGGARIGETAGADGGRVAASDTRIGIAAAPRAWLFEPRSTTKRRGVWLHPSVAGDLAARAGRRPPGECGAGRRSRVVAPDVARAGD
jgi:hypothetical protein